MFDMANDADLFNASRKDSMIPLYEAKMIHHFDHRFATYEGATQAQINKGTLPRFTPVQHSNPVHVAVPRYWISETEAAKRLEARNWSSDWLLCWRRTARSSDERTMISALMPRYAVGDSGFLALASAPAEMCALLAASLSSFVLDYLTRQKMAGANLSYFIVQQLAVPSPDLLRSLIWEWMVKHVLELTYTAWDMTPFARDLGDDGPPFRWDEERRFIMRAELDAAFFHLYGVERDDVGYIMDSFRAFRNNDPARFDRTKGLILQVYDAMAGTTRTGKPYQTILDPPPGHGPRHPPR
jgi:hypothetical protein